MFDNMESFETDKQFWRRKKFDNLIELFSATHNRLFNFE